MATFNQILKEIQAAVNQFNKQIPGIQEQMMEELQGQLRRLDVDSSGNLKQTVGNIKTLASIKSKLTKIVVNDDYLGNVKDFAAAFNTIADLQNEYWTAAEEKFKPGPLLREIRIQAITSTVDMLTENGIGTNITGRIASVLQQNITTGGSLSKLQKTLTTQVVGNDDSDGFLKSYAKQITNDSINQYNAQYTHAVASGLNYEWYAYQGSDITTTRHFCDAMTDFRYFHVSEIPRLLKAVDLYYTDKDGKQKPVEIYPKTGLPYGMIAGTNADNFFINRGGYNCGHQIRPVSEAIVPADIQQRVKATAAYAAYQKLNGS